MTLAISLLMLAAFIAGFGVRHRFAASLPLKPSEERSPFFINGSKQVVHIRGDGRPGVFNGAKCSAMRTTVPQDKDGNMIHGYITSYPCDVPCEFVDSSMRYWCRFHVPPTAKVLERAVAGGDGHATGVCAAHGIDCPKPWSLA